MRHPSGSLSLSTLSPLVQEIVDAAQAEAILLDELAQAVASSDKDAVFVVAQKLTMGGEGSSPGPTGGESVCIL